MPNPSSAPRMYGGATVLTSPALSGEEEIGGFHSAPELATQSHYTSDASGLPLAVHTSILVVEDERIVGLHLRQQLVKLGYRVAAVVSSGDEAIKAVNEQTPDVILMDIHIDGAMDGIDTARQIRTEHALPVIYLTAFSGEATLERAKATKPYGYLLKPFSERELHATIQMALERAHEDQDARDREDRLLIALGLANGSRVWC